MLRCQAKLWNIPHSRLDLVSLAFHVFQPFPSEGMEKKLLNRDFILEMSRGNSEKKQSNLRRSSVFRLIKRFHVFAFR